MRVALAAVLVLAGCSATPSADDAGGAALENAAIATGMVRDPATTEIAGLYSRDTDRICIVADPDAGGHRIGASVDYGGEGCSATGTVTRSGETLRIVFASAPGCSFDARIEQDRITFPGQVPAACEKLCSDRASFAALEVDLLSGAVAEAAAMRDRKGRAMCAGGPTAR